MTSLVNKSADWPPNYHKILIFPPTTSLKCLCAARIHELADPYESTKNTGKVREFCQSGKVGTLVTPN